ncbi:MAG: hypothetical protein Q9208_007381 [Pyrenodesmia sp. 3 TL-2023]
MRGQADDWSNFYEAYDDPQPHQHLPRSATVNARPARKRDERDIPGTDAWIEAQAEKRKKTMGDNARKAESNAVMASRVPLSRQPAEEHHNVEISVEQEQDSHESRLDTPTTPQPSASHLHVDKDDHQERTKSTTEETNDRFWDVAFHPTENIVAIIPPTNSTLEDWKHALASGPKGTALYDALYVRHTWLSTLALAAGEELQREISCSLVVRLPTAEFEGLRKAAEDKAAE